MVRSQATKSLTIQKLATAADVGVETIRYYQRRGLLPVPEAQSKTAVNRGIRHYGEAELQQLRFIKSAQAAGFTLTEIKSLLELDPVADRRQIRALARQRVEELKQKIAELTSAQVMLEKLALRCESSASAKCPIIECFSHHEQRGSEQVVMPNGVESRRRL
jgi:MerR family transcriptional regulator, mercuric resistance operon regulatory protein